MISLSLALVIAVGYFLILFLRLLDRPKDSKTILTRMVLMLLVTSLLVIAIWLSGHNVALAAKIFSPLALLVCIVAAIKSLLTTSSHEHFLWKILKYGLVVFVFFRDTLVALYGINISIPTNLLLIVWLLLPYLQFLFAKLNKEKNVSLSNFGYF